MWYKNPQYFPCVPPTPSPTPTLSPTPTPPPCLKTLGNAPGGSCTSSNCQVTVPGASSTVFGNKRFCSGGCEYKGAVEQQWSNVLTWNNDGTPALCSIGGCSQTFKLSGVHGTGRSCGSDGNPIPGSDELPVIPQPTIPPTSVPPGKCKGQVNGQDVWVNCSDSSKGDSQTTETKNADGTTTTTKTDTVCKNGACDSVVTETKKDAAGNTVSTTVTQQKFDSENGFCDKYPSSSICKNNEKESNNFCKENPDSPICKSGSFSGTCGTAPSCEGDAVQCAQAQYVFKQYCLSEKYLKTDPNSPLPEEIAVQKFNQAVSTGDSGVWSGVQVDSTDLSQIGLTVRSNQSNNPFSSGCPADLPFTFANRAFSIPLSQTCSILQLMGQLIKSIALLMGAVILFKPKD